MVPVTPPPPNWGKGRKNEAAPVPASPTSSLAVSPTSAPTSAPKSAPASAPAASPDSETPPSSTASPLPRPRKERLDALVVRRRLAECLERAQALILEGKIIVEGRAISKAGAPVLNNARIELAAPAMPYVSRGGLKLEAALREFQIDPSGMIALDAGSSTGGFTDCLLQKGAQKVIAADVGRNLLHERLRADPRVEVREGVNIRNLAPGEFDELVDLITMDLSFISIGKVLGALRPILRPQGVLIALIKPQFEARPEDVPRGGVIRDPKVHEKVLQKVQDDFRREGFEIVRIIPSPILGAEGNREFFALARLHFL